MKKRIVGNCICLILSVICVGCANTNNDKVTNEEVSQAITQEKVSLSAGDLIGYKDDNVYSFKGIPYATAERFKMPKPIESYENENQMALTYGAVAPQGKTKSEAELNPYEFITPGSVDMLSSENCQYLNVWTNDLSGNKPVIVLFHGGGITSGASSELSGYTGEYFASKEDVVFVSVNHRLNVLGYLDLSNYGGEEYANSGLVGIEDCVVALEWIQENIKEFGGNPENVTIVGQSGGVQKVTTLASMSNTVDLFDKVVYLSGYYSTSPKEEGEENARKIAEYLQVSDEELIPTLTAMSYDELENTATQAGCSWALNYGIGTFESPFIDENGKMNEYAAQRTYIVGTAYSEMNSNGGSLITEGQNESNYLPNLTDDKATSMLEEIYGDKTPAIIEEYKKTYPDHQLAELLYINLGRDRYSRYGLIEENNGILKIFDEAGVKAYNYVISYKLPYFGGTTMYHSGDIPFWFGSIDEVDHMIQGDRKNARNVSDKMVNALAAFATTGNPSTEELEWKPYTADEHYTMVFDTESACKQDFDLALYNLLMEENQ
ncbi:MAG: carboxylesterase family protein [Eubacteriales bacterium]|nr:carboxylesterase family protein [Eubacteriales bacterium]